MKRMLLFVGFVCAFVVFWSLPVLAVQTYIFYPIAVYSDYVLPGAAMFYCAEGFVPDGHYLLEFFNGEELLYFEEIDLVWDCSDPDHYVFAPADAFWGMNTRSEDGVIFTEFWTDGTEGDVTEIHFTLVSGSSDDSVGDDDSGDDDVSHYFSDVIADLFGPYEQQTETVTEVLSDGSLVTYDRVIPGVAGLDYEWLASVGLFALVLFCFFRIVGGGLKR